MYIFYHNLSKHKQNIKFLLVQFHFFHNTFCISNKNLIFNYTTVSGAEKCAIITTTTTSRATINKEKEQQLSEVGGKQNVNQASQPGSKHDSKSIEFNQIATNKTRGERGQETDNNDNKHKNNNSNDSNRDSSK